MSPEKDYVLGTHDEEIARLGLQHRIWRPRATDAWLRAGFAAGRTIVDLGCGPGWAALDLADIVGANGRVVAVDRSRRFLDALEATARARELAQLEVVELDLDEHPLPDWQADGVWSRWVYAFVSHPRRLLESAARTLKPGGVMVLHEYADYRSWRASPRQPEFEWFVGEVMTSWRERGGEPDIGLELPGWLEELGFELLGLRPLIEVTRAGDFFWEWPRAFTSIGLERMVELGTVSADRARAIAAAVAATEANPHAFQITPLVLEIIARKPG